MPLENLDYLFEDLGIDATPEQIQEMLACFKKDFIDNPFQIKGSHVKVIMQPSYQREYKGMPETFVHLITRENKYKGKREFDSSRANCIHWIKPILINHELPQIKYFEFADEKGIIKHHYWYEVGNFMVVLKPVNPDLLVVTAFRVDNYEVVRFRSRYNEYRNRL